MDHRIPPQNLEAEKSILGGLMLDSEAWDEVSDLLGEEDFYNPAHRKIYRAIFVLSCKGHPCDLITVSNHLMEKKELDSIGGPSYLAAILEVTPSTVNILSYAQIVRDKSLLRSIIKSSQSFIEKALSQDFEDINCFLDDCESEIFSVAEQKTTGGLIPSSDLIKDSLKNLEELYAMKGSLTGLSSGFAELDNMLAGFQKGELIILAARPSMGKTALSLNIMLHAALRNKKKVAYFSVEMAKEAVMMRLLANEADIRLSNMRVGHISDGDWPKLINTSAIMSDCPIFIDDSSDLSPFDIRAKARRMKARYGLDMIIIDYLQLMTLKTKVESREREVSEISRTLKAITKELQIPIMALAQLNRGVEGRSNRRPMLSDLRESGSIEQDADVIMMLYREDYYDRESPEIKGLAEVIINKQRNGPTGTVKLQWEPEFGRFSDHIERQLGPQPPAPQRSNSQEPAPMVLPGPPNQSPKNFAPQSPPS